MESLLKLQKHYFRGKNTLAIDHRINYLKALKVNIAKYEDEIIEALYLDLGKPTFEAYSTEVGFVLDSMGYLIKNIKKWSKSKKVKTPIHQVLTKSYVMYEPYGSVLIVGPFNYPFQLLIEPMIGAIAAGNTVVLKPSEYTKNVEKIIEKIISETFPPEYVAVVTGGREETSRLINMKFDYIFFTGSVQVGKIVMAAAAKNLVPVTLELGGKSPTIVHHDANLKIAARRIAWGKFMNTGQTCIAPDYLYVHEDVKEAFMGELAKTVNEFYGHDPFKSVDYGKIVNENHFDRLADLIDEKKIYHGGNMKREALYIEPTLLNHVTWEDKVMADEIFGPILPILDYSDIDEVFDVINDRPKPLAFYLFTEDRNLQEKALQNISFGGGCINDTISHTATPYLPFGGVGNSGMGSYHGVESFYTFSHRKGVIKKSTLYNMSLILPPYKDKVKFVRKIMK